MISILRHFGVLLRGALNITDSELPKIFISWSLRFLYRFGFVVGWTVLVAMFVARFGIASLPYLFVINGFFTILGSVFYSTFIDRLDRGYLMVANLFIAAGLMIFCLLFVGSHFVWFIAGLIVVEAVFLMQFRILLNGYIEDMFTATESERTFPIIESADTIGGILAGLFVIGFVNVIQIHHFVYFWVIFLLMIVPVVLYFGNLRGEIYLVASENKVVRKLGIVTKLKQEFAGGANNAYIRGLFVIVFFYWIASNLLEFQYTKAIYQNVSDVLLQAGSGFEHAFVHDLGELSILFSFSALLVQLFLGGRLIDKLGVFGSMLIHPLVSILGFLIMLFSFNFWSAVLVKNNFSITSVIYNNSYECGYYAVRERLRGHTRELLEGIVRPFGAVAGTLLIILLQFIFGGYFLTIAINVLMIIIAVAVFCVIYRQQKKYTRLALNDLSYSSDGKVRENAVDILAQRGHSNSVEVLEKVIFDRKEPLSLRFRCVKALGDLNTVESFNVLIRCLSLNNYLIWDTALTAMSKFPFSSWHSERYLMLKFNLISALKRLYSVNKNSDLNVKIIRLMSNLSNVAALEFLLQILNSGKGGDKNSALLALSNYNSLEIEDIVYPYLKSNVLSEAISAALVLYNSDRYGAESSMLIRGVLLSKQLSVVSYGIFAVGELDLRQYIPLCVKYIKSHNRNLALVSAVALVRMGEMQAVDVLVKMLFSRDKTFVALVKKELKHIDVRILKIIDKIIRRKVKEEIDKIVRGRGDLRFVRLENMKLRRLKALYELIEEYDEIEEINKLLI